MREKRTAVIYPWTMSATGSWGPDTGIYELRDKTPDELVEWLWEAGIHPQNTALTELMAHGNPRKAAQVARVLVSSHSVVEESIRKTFGNEIGDYLLKKPLDEIPSNPEEYPRDVKIDYIQ